MSVSSTLTNGVVFKVLYELDQLELELNRSQCTAAIFEILFYGVAVVLSDVDYCCEVGDVE